MTALVGEEVKATLSTVARSSRGHTVAALAQPDHGEGEQTGGLVKPLGVAHQFGAQGVGAGWRGMIEDVSHERNASHSSRRDKHNYTNNVFTRKQSQSFKQTCPFARAVKLNCLLFRLD
jgi:hypothetical protein